MMRDDSTGGWVPMGGGGWSEVAVRRRKIQHEGDQPCRHEYLIHGKRISDQTVRDKSYKQGFIKKEKNMLPIACLRLYSRSKVAG